MRRRAAPEDPSAASGEQPTSPRQLRWWRPLTLTRAGLDQLLRPKQAARNAGDAADELATTVREGATDLQPVGRASDSDRGLRP